LAFAALGGESVSGAVRAELDRRAAAVLVRRILARPRASGRRPAARAVGRAATAA
jgi:hypothetical protein